MEGTQASIISQLVQLHGEGGLSPTADQWAQLLALGQHVPVRVVNLLEFHETVEDGDRTVSGGEAYAAYLAGEMADEDVTDARLAPSLDALPTVPA